jgi:phosphoribosylglycinamide formyltransferase-1
MKKLVILISGRGSNMQALLEAKLPCRIAAVISNRADAGGLAIAKAHGIPALAVEHRKHADRESFDTALAQAIDAFDPDLVALAGFMRILGAGFVARYRGRLINIHPSLLPAYSGLNTHARALLDGVKIHGCTVHFVTHDLDHGPIIIQAAARVLSQEHRIYPQAISWLCQDQVKLSEQGRVQFLYRKQPGFALVSPSLE